MNLSLQDAGDACPGISGNITQYQISFQTGSSVATEIVNITRCTAWWCSHTFEPSSNPPSSYDSVSVAAKNVVGMGAARTCTAQTISKSFINQHQQELWHTANTNNHRVVALVVDKLKRQWLCNLLIAQDKQTGSFPDHRCSVSNH